MLANRFKTSFPIVYKFLSDLKLQIAIFLPAIVLTGIYSIHYSLSVVILFYLVLSYALERRHLHNILFTPLTTLAQFNFLALGLGASFVVNANYGEFDPYIFAMQSAYVLTFPTTLLIYRSVTKSLPRFSLPDPALPESKSFYQNLKIIGWVLFAYGCMGLMVGVITGSSDRGNAGEFIVETKYGIWTAFVIFSRFSYISFVLLPFLIKSSRPIQRYAIYFILVIYLVLCFATGSRGALIYPIVYMMIGYWMFGGKANVVKQIFILIVIGSLVLIPVMDAYRGTSSFSKSALSNPIERLAAIQDTNEILNDPKRQSSLLTTGRALVGSSDALIYENTPSKISHAYWENIDAMLYIWVPKIIAPWKPLLLDGDQIASTYSGIKHDRSSANISFNGDMYRRFGWIGIVLGNFCFALFYSFVTWYVFSFYYRKDALFGFLMILLTFSFIINVPCSTLLTTFWIWLWDIPKYVLAFISLCIVAKRITNTKSTLSGNKLIGLN